MCLRFTVGDIRRWAEGMSIRLPDNPQSLRCPKRHATFDDKRPLRFATKNGVTVVILGAITRLGSYGEVPDPPSKKGVVELFVAAAANVATLNAEREQDLQDRAAKPNPKKTPTRQRPVFATA